MKIFRILLLLFIYAFSGFSQGQGSLILRTNPPTGFATFKIQDSLYTEKQLDIYQMPSGQYPMRIWAPGYLEKDTVLFIQSDSLHIFRTTLDRDPIYLKFVADKKTYYKAKIGMTHLPDAITISLFTAATLTYLPTLDFDEKVEELRSKYAVAGPEQGKLILFKRQLADLQQQTKASRNRALGLAIGGLVFIHFRHILRKKFKKHFTKPSYEPNNPFQLELSNINNAPGLSLKFNFR